MFYKKHCDARFYTRKEDFSTQLKKQTKIPFQLHQTLQPELKKGVARNSQISPKEKPPVHISGQLCMKYKSRPAMHDIITFLK